MGTPTKLVGFYPSPRQPRRTRPRSSGDRATASGAVCAGSNPAGGTPYEVPKDPAISGFAENGVFAYVPACVAVCRPGGSVSAFVDSSWTGSWWRRPRSASPNDEGPRTDPGATRTRWDSGSYLSYQGAAVVIQLQGEPEAAAAEQAGKVVEALRVDDSVEQNLSRLDRIQLDLPPAGPPRSRTRTTRATTSRRGRRWQQRARRLGSLVQRHRRCCSRRPTEDPGAGRHRICPRSEHEAPQPASPALPKQRCAGTLSEARPGSREPSSVRPSQARPAESSWSCRASPAVSRLRWRSRAMLVVRPR